MGIQEMARDQTGAHLVRKLAPITPACMDAVFPRGPPTPVSASLGIQDQTVTVMSTNVPATLA